jgi:hypothetical protein
MVQTIEKKEAKEFYIEEEVEVPIKIEGFKEEFVNQIDLIFNIPDNLELLKKKGQLRKALKKWKQNIDYYYLHIDEFESGFKDL